MVARMYYGLTRKSQAYEMVADVVSILGGGKNAENLLIETLQQETHIGEFKDTTPNGAGRGIAQFDKKGFYDCVQRAKTEEINKIIRSLGMDIWSLSHDDLNFSPLASIVLCRLKYKRIPEPIPTTVNGRASYWKKYYNSWRGKGTVEEYLENSKKIQWPDHISRNNGKTYEKK